jgi:hypothetical protein
MTEKEIKEVFDNLKLERIKSKIKFGKITAHWELKSLYNDTEINLGDANACIKTSIHFN